MSQALAGAKLVHVFDRWADETIEWIQEKDAALSCQGYGQDLEMIQALVQQHQLFETDLAAVKEQVCLVSTLMLLTAVQVYT
jgi:spectrin beta